VTSLFYSKTENLRQTMKQERHKFESTFKVSLSSTSTTKSYCDVMSAENGSFSQSIQLQIPEKKMLRQDGAANVQLKEQQPRKSREPTSKMRISKTRQRTMHTNRMVKFMHCHQNGREALSQEMRKTKVMKMLRSRNDEVPQVATRLHHAVHETYVQSVLQPSGRI